MVDAGSSLSAVDLSELKVARLKASLMAEVFAADGVDAMALSARDWRLGRPFVDGLVQTHKLPIVAANLTCEGERPYPSHRVVEVGGQRVGVIGLTDGVVPGCVLEAPGAALERAKMDLPPVDLTVALLPSERRILSKLPAVPADIAVIVGPGTSVDLGSALVVGPVNRGKKLGRVRVDRTGPGGPLWSAEKLRALKSTVARYKDGVARAQAEPETDRKARRVQSANERLQRAEAAVEAYGDGDGRSRAEVEYLELSDEVADYAPTAARVVEVLSNLEAAAGAPIPDDAPRTVAGVGPFVGADGCVACHAQESAQWRGTPHATAWETLRDDQHGRDPACVGCHVTGWKVPGGPQEVAVISPFRGVQCEACHGPGRSHVRAPSASNIVRSPDESTCRTCHDGDRDRGRFDHATYRPRVVHSK